MYKIKVRAIVGIMIFLGYFLIYVVRYNLSVHIVDMAHLINDDNASETEDTSITRNNEKLGTRQRKVIEIINWDDGKMALLFAAYHVGYCVCFPLFHNMGDWFGPTWVVGLAGITSGVLNCVTPTAAYQPVWVLFVVRTLKGFCAGAMLPSMVQLLRHWVPPIERYHFIWAYCGITTGTFSTFLICSLVHYYSRWHLGFYVSGSIQILWAIVWLLIITDYPSKHPFISNDEQVYLSRAIGTIFTIKWTNSQTPWILIMKSAPFWIICFLNFGYAWMIMSLCLHGPLYYSRVAGYSIYNASVLTAIPFFLRLVLGAIAIQSFHWYKHHSNYEIKHIKKYFVLVSHVIPGLLVAGTWITKIAPGPILLTIAIALTAGGMDLTLTLCYDISPTYVSSINTVIRMIGNIPGIIISLSVGEVTNKYENTVYVWKHIWCFHATVLLLSGIIFIIWGNTDVQPWNTPTSRSRTRRLARTPKNNRRSLMSNIIEVDEDDLNRASGQYNKQNSFLTKGPFKIPQSTV